MTGSLPQIGWRDGSGASTFNCALRGARRDRGSAVFAGRSPAGQIQIVREFDREDVPLGARSIAADSRGFLWVASDTGLYRFDGRQFHLFDSHPALAVQTTSDGWVWAGGKEGLIRIRKNERIIAVREGIRAIQSHGRRIVAAGDRLWAGDAAGIELLAGNANGGFTGDREGHVWFGCGNVICEVSTSGVHRASRGSRSG